MQRHSEVQPCKTPLRVLQAVSDCCIPRISPNSGTAYPLEVLSLKGLPLIAAHFSAHHGSNRYLCTPNAHGPGASCIYASEQALKNPKLDLHENISTLSCRCHCLQQYGIEVLLIGRKFATLFYKSSPCVTVLAGKEEPQQKGHYTKRMYSI